MMTTSQPQKKMFGVALDPADDPFSLELKRAWMMNADEGIEGIAAFWDPYDAIKSSMSDILKEKGIELAGKFTVPSWLWPKPKSADFPRITTEKFGEFYDSGGLLKLIRRLQSFTEKKILPAIPFMVGVDHAASAGVISALAGKFTPEVLNVIVLDQHFDAIPLSIRLTQSEGAISNPMTGVPIPKENIPTGQMDQFCCGNFWAYLMDEGIVLPQNLSFIGVGDYPGKANKTEKENLFQKAYLDFENRGCSFFPLQEFEGQYMAKLTEFIHQKITGNQVYISLDLDVGAYNSTYAARYMDRPGISRENLLDFCGIIREKCRKENLDLAGFDIMEFNMHFLGLETDDIKDETLSLVRDFISALT